MSQWADEFRVLSSEASAEPGRWSTADQPYQREIMDCAGDPAIPKMVFMASAQIGKTEICLNLVGFHIDRDPGPILFLQPTLDIAKAYSNDRLSPMLRDSKCFRGKIADSRTRDSGNTIFSKAFVGGQVTMAGANSPASLSSRPIRILVCDEVDRYPASAGSEGDPVALATKRTTRFFNRKIILASTPTIKGLSRIEKAWEASDQRRYHVPCPHCGLEQVLEWGSRETLHGMKWRRDEAGRGLPETAFYVCKSGCVIDEVSKPAMVRAGKWVPTNPAGTTVGFHIWAAYSLHVNSAWPALVQEWLDAGSDSLMRQTFTNLVLGETYEDRGSQVLSERTIAAAAETWEGDAPDTVAVITAGVDVQDDRAEIEYVGWGRDEESWSLDHDVIEGDPDTASFWEEVDLALQRRFSRADGRALPVMAACVDSGGHHTQKVYEFCKARLGRRIYAIKGEAARAGRRSPVWPTKRPSAKNKASFRPIIIGVNAAKDVIRNRLHLKRPDLLGPIPGYMHFPADRDIGYFAQMVSERSVTKQVGGEKFRVWELAPGRANEALDCRVYAYAALCALLHFGLKLNARVAEIEAEAAPDQGTPAQVIPPRVQGPVYAAPRPVVQVKPGDGRRSISSQLA